MNVTGVGTTEYLYGDPVRPTKVTHIRESEGTFTSLAYDDLGHLVRMKQGANVYAVGTDHLGSPRVVVNAAGAAVKVIRRDAYGHVLADSNPGFDLPLGFAGGLTEPVLGLIRFGVRGYHPPSGRWTSLDPSYFLRWRPSQPLRLRG